MKMLEGLAGSATEAVDGLVGVADGEEISLRTGEARKNFDLSEVGVLKFVGENEASAAAGLGQNRFVAV